ncbi:MAG: zf-HC2 domain-containing protein [Gemmatimonadaceae bacterium]|nr:zf-HC2 domain-containing protein [Gemmatimonadaceae bacterium]
MNDPIHTPAPDTAACAEFDARLSDYLEQSLDVSTRDTLDRHRASCARCDATVQALDSITRDAKRLPLLSPSRDLWAGIHAQLDAPVIPIGTSEPLPRYIDDAHLSASTPTLTSVATRRPRFRQLAIAATMLVAVSSAVTWQVARRVVDTSASLAADSEGSPARRADSSVMRLAVASPDVLYEEEIAALRDVVSERLSELDPETVAVLEKNIAIIDQAIAESRAALARDPNSRVVPGTLTRALESKVALLRRVALL